MTGCAGEERIFLTDRSCGTKACSDGLGHLRRPLSTAIADRSDSGGRKPGRWFFFHSRSTPHHPFRPSWFYWACSAQRPPSALRVVSALWVRDGLRTEPSSPAPIPQQPVAAAGVFGETQAVAPQVAFSVYSVSVIYLCCLLILGSSTEEAC